MFCDTRSSRQAGHTRDFIQGRYANRVCCYIRSNDDGSEYKNRIYDAR